MAYREPAQKMVFTRRRSSLLKIDAGDSVSERDVIASLHVKEELN